MGGFTSQTKKYFSALIIALASITLIAAFQNCGGPSAITFDTMSTLVDLPTEVPLETIPALPEIGLRTILQPTFYRTEKGLRDWAALTYQWYLNGKPMGSQKSVQIILEPFQIKDVGVYQLEIKNEFTSITSGSFTLTGSDVAKSLPESISITYSPNTYAPSKQVKGSPISLSLVEGGTNKDWGYFEYEWLKSSVPVPNAVGRTLTITNLQIADEGVYALKMIDPQDRTKNRFSNSVALAIFDPSRQLPDEVQIAINPNPAKVGDTVTLSASFPKDPLLSTQSVGMNPEQYYSFQWICKQRACAGTTATASLDKIALTDAGNYQLKISLLSNSGISKTIDPVQLKVDPIGCTADSDGNTVSRTGYVLASAASASACNDAKVTQSRVCSPQDTWGSWTPTYQNFHANCTVAASVEQPKACPNDGYGTSRNIYTTNSGDCAAAYKQQTRSCGTSGSTNGQWSAWSPSVPEPVYPNCNSQTPAKTCPATVPSRTVYTAQTAPDCNSTTVKISQTGVCNTNTGTYDTWTPSAGAEYPGCTTRKPCKDSANNDNYGDESKLAYTANSASNCDSVKSSQTRSCNTSFGTWSDWTPSNYFSSCETLAISGTLTTTESTCTIPLNGNSCAISATANIQNIPSSTSVFVARSYIEPGSGSVTTDGYSLTGGNTSFTGPANLLLLAPVSHTFSLRQNSASGTQIGSAVTVSATCAGNNVWNSSTKKCEPPPITGTLSAAATTCIIPVNAKYCTVSASVSVQNIPAFRAVWLGQQYRNAGGSLIYGGSQLTSGEPSYSNSNYQLQVKYGQNDFDLRAVSVTGTAFGTNSAKATITGSCDQSGGVSTWNYQTETCEKNDNTAPTVTSVTCTKYQVYGNAVDGSEYNSSARKTIVDNGTVSGTCELEASENIVLQTDKISTIYTHPSALGSQISNVKLLNPQSVGGVSTSKKVTLTYSTPASNALIGASSTFFGKPLSVQIPLDVIKDLAGNVGSGVTSGGAFGIQDCGVTNNLFVDGWKIRLASNTNQNPFSADSPYTFPQLNNLSIYASNWPEAADVIVSSSFVKWSLPNWGSLASNRYSPRAYLHFVNSTQTGNFVYQISTDGQGQSVFKLFAVSDQSHPVFQFDWAASAGYVDSQGLSIKVYLISRDGKQAIFEFPKKTSGSATYKIKLNNVDIDAGAGFGTSINNSAYPLFKDDETDTFRKARAMLPCL